MTLNFSSTFTWPWFWSTLEKSNMIQMINSFVYPSTSRGQTDAYNYMYVYEKCINDASAAIIITFREYTAP